MAAREIVMRFAPCLQQTHLYVRRVRYNNNNLKASCARVMSFDAPRNWLRLYCWPEKEIR